MKATVIVDNIRNQELHGEWGLCVYIEFEDKKVLLDAGSSGLFVENAWALGLDLTDVEYGVLSHAHYDHGNGMEQFFQINSRAKFYVRSACRENCYSQKTYYKKYIGIPKGLVIFNSCCHGGAANVINAVAAKVKETGIKYIYMGHCTGEKAFGILKEELGECVQQLHVGLVMEF